MIEELTDEIGARPSGAGTGVPVLIVGAGPVGLSLALGLAHMGVRSIVLERNSTTSAQSKAPAIHIRSREVFRQWGVEDQMLEEGVLLEELTLHRASPGSPSFFSVSFEELSREAYRPGLLILEQGKTERILLNAVRATGMSDVRFDAEVTALEMDEEGATVTFHSSGEQSTLRAAFVAGCDGARSFVRRSLGLSFDGMTYSVRPMLADVRVEDDRDDLPWPRMYNGVDGLTNALQLQPGHWRIIRLESDDLGREDEVPEAEVDDRVREVLGDGPVEVIWASRFRIHLRHAPRFRVGRAVLAGDAAHIHSPAGGLGMNTGIQDAHNLAWKLAYALRGGNVEQLLDSYDVERRAVAVESVSNYADYLTRVFLLSPRLIRGLIFRFIGLLPRIPRARRRALRRATMIELHYPASPLLNKADRSAGVRLPNVVLRGTNGVEHRLYDLAGYEPVLLEIGKRLEVESLRAGEASDLPRFYIGPGGYTDASGLLSRLLDGQAGVILVRPDRHVAWARGEEQMTAHAVQQALGLTAARIFGTVPVG